VRRLVNVPLNYTGFEVPEEFVVGYGLDYREEYRNLPFIGVLGPEETDSEQRASVDAEPRAGFVNKNLPGNLYPSQLFGSVTPFQLSPTQLLLRRSIATAPVTWETRSMAYPAADVNTGKSQIFGTGAIMGRIKSFLHIKARNFAVNRSIQAHTKLT